MKNVIETHRKAVKQDTVKKKSLKKNRYGSTIYVYQKFANEIE